MRCCLCHKPIQGKPVVLPYIGPLKSRHNPLTTTRYAYRCEKCHREAEEFERQSRARYIKSQLALIAGLSNGDPRMADLLAEGKAKFEAELAELEKGC